MTGYQFARFMPKRDFGLPESEEKMKECIEDGRYSHISPVTATPDKFIHAVSRGTITKYADFQN